MSRYSQPGQWSRLLAGQSPSMGWESDPDPVLHDRFPEERIVLPPILAPDPLARHVFAAPIDRPGGEIAIVDSDWKVIATNEAWDQSTALEATRKRVGVGANLMDCCLDEARSGIVEAAAIAQGMRIISLDRARHFRHSYCVGSTGDKVDVVITRFDGVGACYAIVSRTNVAELTKLRTEQRRLTRRLLRAQEEERRRVARDLHDTSAQHLVGMSLSLARLQSLDLPPLAAGLVTDMSELLNHFYRDLRGMSFLMHPPTLEPGGLGQAVQSLCDGFGARSDLDVRCRVFTRGEPSICAEAAIYRLLQEALGNVQKHARAATVDVRLELRRNIVILVVRDDGIGIDVPLSGSGDHSRIGVGISGMFARVTELGGRLSVYSPGRGRGTVVAAAIPNRASN